MNPKDLELCRDLYRHLHAKHKGLYGFQGDLNPIGPEGSSHKVLYPIVFFLSLATKLPRDGCSSNSQ